MPDNSDDTLTNLDVFITSYSYEHKGWVIFRQVNHHLTYYDGVWDSRPEAQVALDELNLSQGVNVTQEKAPPR